MKKEKISELLAKLLGNLKYRDGSYIVAATIYGGVLWYIDTETTADPIPQGHSLSDFHNTGKTIAIKIVDLQHKLRRLDKYQYDTRRVELQGVSFLEKDIDNLILPISNIVGCDAIRVVQKKKNDTLVLIVQFIIKKEVITLFNNRIQLLPQPTE